MLSGSQLGRQFGAKISKQILEIGALHIKEFPIKNLEVMGMRKPGCLQYTLCVLARRSHMSTTEGVRSIELICGLGMIQEHTTGLQSAASESCPCRRGAAQPALPSRIPPGGTGPRLVAWALGWVGACAVAAASVAAPTIPALQGGSTAGNRSRWQGARG